MRAAKAEEREVGVGGERGSASISCGEKTARESKSLMRRKDCLEASKRRPTECIGK